MFASPLVDKENVLGEIAATTPSRKPLKMVQMVTGNMPGDGAMMKRTPKQRTSLAGTPSSRSRLSRRLKRQSMPFGLSKPLSIFEDDVNSGLSLKRSVPNQELNEMIRDKVAETVNKIKERYEMSLAEKEQRLDEKNSIIEKLQSELNILKQSPNAETNDTNISMLVEQVISNAIQEIREEDQVSSISQTKEEAIPMDCKENNLSIEKKDSWTTMTPTAVKTHSATSMTPVQKADAILATTPIPVKDTMTSPTHTTTTSPIYRIDTTTSSASGTPEEKAISENGICNKATPVQDDELCTQRSLECITEEKMSNAVTGESSIQVGTSMTPVELLHKYTHVSPAQTSNASVVTSPLVAALQPDIISSLPLNTLRAELESAAISNELLRNECDSLNARIEDLQTGLAQGRADAETKCKALQDVVDSLESKLAQALEENYQMEMKKPLTVEEYDDTISRLQKDVLLKEKQITFYTKRATEAENLQKDLRRMYAKYNAEHQLLTKLEEESKVLREQYNARCAEHESLQSELSAVKDELQQARRSIAAQDKVREEAKESQVKCSILEEQIEAFQWQQKENLEFLEQERKGLEETSLELEQLVRMRTEELDATRLALEKKTEQYEEMRESEQTLRGELSDVQVELNAVQSQAYLVMLEQEKELTAVSRVLDETWERLVTVVETKKEQVRLQKEPVVQKESEAGSKEEFKPSFVYSVLAAVSGTAPHDDVKELESEKATTEEEEDHGRARDARDESPAAPDEFTLESRAKACLKLLAELETYVQENYEHAERTIQRHAGQIENLEECLRQTTEEYEGKITRMKEEMANEADEMKKASEGNDQEKQTLVLQERFTELLNKKSELEREVEKLQTSFSKALKAKETFAQYNTRLENKASIVASNLMRAEEEIYRLDGIVDRFCTATQNSWQTMTSSDNLRDLLKELNVIV